MLIDQHLVAIGIDGDAVVGAVEAAMTTTGERPERTLVVTDALSALGPLRALGVGVEHVPAAGSREADVAVGRHATANRWRRTQ